MTQNDHDNDNFDPWQSLGLQTLLILNRLRLQAQLLEFNKEEDAERTEERDNGTSGNNRALDKRELTERRIREIQRFEDRAAGKRR